MTQMGSIGPWRIETNAAVCSAESIAPDGSRVSFAINAKGAAASVAIFDARWDIPEGEYGVSMWVDRSLPQVATAMAVGRMAIGRSR